MYQKWFEEWRQAVHNLKRRKPQLDTFMTTGMIAAGRAFSQIRSGNLGENNGRRRRRIAESNEGLFENEDGTLRSPEEIFALLAYQKHRIRYPERIGQKRNDQITILILQDLYEQEKIKPKSPPKPEQDSQQSNVVLQIVSLIDELLGDLDLDDQDRAEYQTRLQEIGRQL